jgi:hypothetical protein
MGKKDKKNKKKWSRRVTRESDALDLENGIFKKRCRVSETVGRTQRETEIEPLPLRDVDADILYQSRRTSAFAKPPRDAGRGEGRIAQGFRQDAEAGKVKDHDTAANAFPAAERLGAEPPVPAGPRL